MNTPCLFWGGVGAHTPIPKLSDITGQEKVFFGHILCEGEELFFDCPGAMVRATLEKAHWDTYSVCSFTCCYCWILLFRQLPSYQLFCFS